MKQTDSGCWLIESSADVDMFRRIVAGRTWAVGVDVETFPVDPKRKTPKAWVDGLLGVGVAFYEDAPDDFDAASELTVYGEATDAYITALTDVLARRPWYAHNAMFDAQVLRRYGIRLGRHVGDPRIIAYLLGEPEAGLKPLLAQYMGIDIIEYAALLAEYGVADLRGVPMEVVATYCGSQDAEQVVRLERLMRSELASRAPAAFDVYTRVELDMVTVLVEMTHRGIRFDRTAGQPLAEAATTGRERLDAVIDSLVKGDGFLEYEKRAGKLWLPTCKVCRNGKLKRVDCEGCGGRGKLDPVPMTFNPGSWQQRGRFLYDHVGIPKRRYAGGVQQWQIDKGYVDPEDVAGATDALAMLQAKDRHPTIPLLIVRAKTAKDEGFLWKWLELSEADGRLHTEFTNTTVASGRLSSREPNLQQVTARFRHLFLPDEDCVVVAGDMSQLELVIGAHASRDPVMVAIINNGWDMHRITAEAIYGIDWRTVQKDDPTRNTAKVVNYLSSYGGQAHKLIEGLEKLSLSRPELGLTVPSLEEARRIIAAAKAKYAEYWAWAERVKSFTRVNGFVMTTFGRPRFLPDINSPDGELRSSAERQAVNHAIQGTAADLMKMSMVNISNDVEMSKMGYMVLQVHDEIVSIVRREAADAYVEKLRRHMELGQPLWDGTKGAVKLTVDVGVAGNWRDTHK